MTPTAYGRSLIRTIVPIAVGSLVGWLATRGVEVDASTIIPTVDAILAAVYYGVVSAVEQKWPAAGWLLGYPGAPSYAPRAAGGADAVGIVPLPAGTVSEGRSDSEVLSLRRSRSRSGDGPGEISPDDLTGVRRSCRLLSVEEVPRHLAPSEGRHEHHHHRPIHSRRS